MYSFSGFILGLLCCTVVFCKLCDISNITCMTTLANNLLPSVIAGLGSTKSLMNATPMFADTIIGDSPTVKYTFKNVSWTGFEDCKIKKLEIIKATTSFEKILECPKLKTNIEHHKIIGNIGTLYVNGEGSISTTAYGYVFNIHGHYDKYIKDDKLHFQIKDYVFDLVNEGHVDFDIVVENYEEEEAQKLKDYVKSNWSIVDKTLREPAITKLMEIFFKKLNSFFDVVPVEVILKID